MIACTKLIGRMYLLQEFFVFDIHQNIFLKIYICSF